MPPAYAHDPFLALHQAVRAPWLDWAMVALSVACTGWAVALVALAILSWLERDLRGLARSYLPLAAALGAQAAAVQAIKLAVAAPRPIEVFGPAVVRQLLPTEGAAFPSGHAAAAALLASYATLVYGRRAAPLWALAFLGGLSRIYVGAHFALDVVGGWALGAAVGVALYAAVLGIAPGGHLALLRASRRSGSKGP